MRVFVTVSMTVAMMRMAKMLLAMLIRRFPRIARLDGPFVSVRVHIHELFYARSNPIAQQCRDLITHFDTSPF
jgi:hypothetical protein